MHLHDYLIPFVLIAFYSSESTLAKTTIPMVSDVSSQMTTVESGGVPEVVSNASSSTGMELITNAVVSDEAKNSTSSPILGQFTGALATESTTFGSNPATHGSNPDMGGQTISVSHPLDSTIFISGVSVQDDNANTVISSSESSVAGPVSAETSSVAGPVSAETSSVAGPVSAETSSVAGPVSVETSSVAEPVAVDTSSVAGPFFTEGSQASLSSSSSSSHMMSEVNSISQDSAATIFSSESVNSVQTGTEQSAQPTTIYFDYTTAEGISVHWNFGITLLLATACICFIV